MWNITGYDLSCVTTGDLENEIQRRKKIFSLSNIPEARGDFSIASLKKRCQEYMEAIALGLNGEAERLEKSIHEEAIEMFFGSDVWEWVRERSE